MSASFPTFEDMVEYVVSPSEVELTEELSRGSYGSVHLAWYEGTRVVVKVSVWRVVERIFPLWLKLGYFLELFRPLSRQPLLPVLATTLVDDVITLGICISLVSI